LLLIKSVGKNIVKLFDYEKADLIYFGSLLILSLWLFMPGFHADRIMMPFPDDMFTNEELGYTVSYDTTFPIGADVNLEYQPWNDYTCERLKQGHIPFWNPYNLCGTPFFANSLNQLTYIPRLILSLILPAVTVLTALAFLHFLLMGIGSYYLMKAYRVSPIAAGAAAFILLFKYTPPTIMMMPPLALTLALMPLGLLFAVKLMRGGRWLYAIYLGVCLSCLISSGYPVFTIHFLYFGIALVIFEYLYPQNSGNTNRKVGLYKIICGAILGLSFSLAQIIPTVQFYLLSSRPPIMGDISAHAHFMFAHLGMMIYQSLLFPSVSRTNVHTFAQNLGNLYLGAVPFLLPLPLYGQWNNRAYRFFFGSSIIAALISFSTPLFHAAQRFIPGFGLSPVQPFPLFFFCFIFALGLSIDHLLKIIKKPSRLQVILIVIVGALIALIPYPVILLRREPENFIPNYIVFLFSEVLILIAILLQMYKRRTKFFASALLIVLAINLLPPMRRWVTFYGPENSLGLKCHNSGSTGNYGLDKPRYYNATGTSFLSSNINIYPRLRLVQGYDSLVLKSFVDEFSKYIPKGVKRSRRLINNAGEAPDGLLRETGAGRVIHNPLIEPVGARETAGCLELYTTDVSYPECTITNGTCEMHRISPECIDITIDANQAADLKVAETYYPGWRYRLDGNPQAYKVQQSDEGFMKVPDISPGTKKATLFYDPRLERLGLILASLSFVIGIVFILLLDKRAKGSRNY